MKPHYEVVSAKKYYGAKVTGSVLLRNGCVQYHGTTKEVKKLYKQVMELYEDKK